MKNAELNFWIGVGKAVAGGMRMGQAAFNVLESQHPGLAEEIRGKELDPFYVQTDDPRWEAFLDWIHPHLQDLSRQG